MADSSSYCSLSYQVAQAVDVSSKTSNSPPGIRTAGWCELIWIIYCGYLGTATDRANSTWLSHQPRANTSYISQKQAGIYNCFEPKWISDWRKQLKRKKLFPKPPNIILLHIKRKKKRHKELLHLFVKHFGIS